VSLGWYDQAMRSSEILTDGYGRLPELVHRAADGLTAEQLAFRPEPGANSIAWLVWHLSRVQDDHLAGVTGQRQLWDQSWVERTGIDRDVRTFGFGDGPHDVAGVLPPGPGGLLAYHDAVMERTTAYLASVEDEDLDRVVDTRWTPPVTAGVRLVSVLSDNLQHAGQALFVRGILERTAQRT
jgi:hypothetical protein